MIPPAPATPQGLPDQANLGVLNGFSIGTVFDDDAARLPHDVVGFLDRRERARPRQVEPDAVLVAVAHEANDLEGFDDLDSVGAHGLLHPVGIWYSHSEKVPAPQKT